MTCCTAWVQGCGELGANDTGRCWCGLVGTHVWPMAGMVYPVSTASELTLIPYIGVNRFANKTGTLGMYVDLYRTPKKESRLGMAAGGGTFESENGAKVHLPWANLYDPANQADHLLENGHMGYSEFVGIMHS
ncbi:hypothetical protein E3N88_04456 [Mikania micrantha]|uniref:Uncharacterized protein n=1 Tax=Mikania micrantha TaxID=192012 RepID=A0A5N6PWM3_9ASTR|nr:hypothetical protein E3N88_04456 [Mikania micrantha]